MALAPPDENKDKLDAIASNWVGVFFLEGSAEPFGEANHLKAKAMAEGYIYILLNRAFQNDHYKIGVTTKTPEERARELSGATGVPRDFEVLYEQRVIDCKRAERVLHRKLHQYRSGGNREFFHIPLKVAIKTLEGVADEIGRVDDVAASVPQTLSTNDDAVLSQSGE